RATFMPCSPSGIAQPRITSSISLASTSGTRASASLMASAARSSGRVARSEPLKARPTGVRTEETITGSGIGTSRIASDQRTEIGDQNKEKASGLRPELHAHCWASESKKQPKQNALGLRPSADQDSRARTFVMN